MNSPPSDAYFLAHSFTHMHLHDSRWLTTCLRKHVHPHVITCLIVRCLSTHWTLPLFRVSLHLVHSLHLLYSAHHPPCGRNCRVMSPLCGDTNTSYTKHMLCWGNPASTTVVVTKPFWKDGTMMTNTASLCQALGGLRNRSFNMMQSHCKITLTWLHGKKEVGTENPGNFLWMQKVFKGH